MSFKFNSILAYFSSLVHTYSEFTEVFGLLGDEILFQVSGFVTLTYTWGKNPIRQQDKQNNQWSFLCTSHMKMHLEKNKLEVLVIYLSWFYRI